MASFGFVRFRVSLHSAHQPKSPPASHLVASFGLRGLPTLMRQCDCSSVSLHRYFPAENSKEVAFRSMRNIFFLTVFEVKEGRRYHWGRSNLSVRKEIILGDKRRSNLSQDTAVDVVVRVPAFRLRSSEPRPSAPPPFPCLFVIHSHSSTAALIGSVESSPCLRNAGTGALISLPRCSNH